MSLFCPVCNGMVTVETTCSECGNKMVDYGRVMDFDGWDPYSPYLEIDGMKKSDGIQNDYSNHQCAHVFTCESCGHLLTQVFDEVDQ
jgi:hypothetical protein